MSARRRTSAAGRGGPASPRAALARLVRLLDVRTPEAAREKRALVRALAGASLTTAPELRRLHEALLFLRAFPDDAALLGATDAALARFARRRDLARFRAELADSGIAGTDLHYPFFQPTARRLATSHPGRLSIDWASFDDEEERAPLTLLATLLLSPAEAALARERGSDARELLALAAGGRRTDAEALLDRLDALPGDDALREALHDRVAPFYRLASGATTPARTSARAAATALRFRACPFSGRRPDLAAELVKPPRTLVEVRGREADALVELARDAMACRARDLDCFAYGDPGDVRRIVDDDGLEFAAIGSRVDRRLPLSAAYGLLTLRNGVPTGYVQLDGFLGTCLVHFNVFESFRGTDAAWVFARTLAAARALFGSHAFAIEPYQLGHGNDEALDSGAWWFYRKLGFAPRHAATARLAAREERRLRRAGPRARSSRATLARLARVHLFFEPFGRPAHVPPHAALAKAAICAAAAAADPATLANEVAHALALDTGSWQPAERLWLERWAPFVSALPGFATWPSADRRALGALVRAKAAPRESDSVALARAHPRFGPALLELARQHGAERDLAPED